MRSRHRRPRLFLKGRNPRSRRRLLAIFVLVFGASAAPRSLRADCVELTAPLSISTTANGPVAVFAADVDRDGDLDLIAANQGGDQVAWYRNDGGGAFALRTISLAAGAPIALAAGDLDGDGDVDAVSSASESTNLFWYRNDGNGGSWVQQTLGTHSSAFSVAVADLDRDGDADVVSVSNSANQILYFRNSGDGALWTSVNVGAATNALSLAVGDVDGDGDPDVLAAASGSDALFWYANNGTGGGWTQSTVASAVFDAQLVAVGDLDRDGDLDALSADFGDHLIAWHENLAPGNGTLWSRHSISTALAEPYAMITADLDGDGDLDVIASSLPEDTTLWFENGASGTWTRHTLAAEGDVNPNVLAAADLDRDGDLDLARGAIGANRIDWFRNSRLHGEALFGAVRSISTTALAPRSLVVADLDGDGDLDPFIANDAGDAIDIWANNGTGSSWNFSEPVGSAEGSRAAVAGDLDRDGDLDLIGASTVNGDVTWYRNEGAGAFSQFGIDPSLIAPWTLALGDLDGDGRTDVAVGDQTHDAIFWYQTDGTPASGPWTRLTIGVEISDPVRLRAADLDRDGDVDLAVAAPIPDAIYWFENISGVFPTWTRHTLADSVDAPTGFDLGDLDGDGDLDAFSATELGSAVWFEADSTPTTGTWTRHTVLTAGGELFDLALADLDGDGDLDAALTDGSDSAVLALVNDGAGEFAARTVAQIAAPTEIAASDLDRDGDLDLTVATTNSLVWVPNLGTRIHDDGFDSDGASTACWSTSVPPVP